MNQGRLVRLIRGGGRPIITSADTITVSEGIGVHRQLIANVPVTWAITGGAQAGDFTLDGNYLDLPAPAQVGVYSVQVTATRPATGKTATQTITATVIALSITSSSSASGNEGVELSGVLNANEPVTWAKIGGAQQADFTLVGDTWTLPASKVDGSYAVQWQATSLDGLRTASQNFTATLAAAGPVEALYGAPGPLWAGSPDQGWAGDVPTDEARTGPKVALLPLQDTSQLANDHDELLLGCRGGCYGGLRHVLAQVDGNEYIIPAETRETYASPRGAPWADVGLTGWFIRIRKADLPASVHGSFRVRFKGVPNNPLIQPTVTAYTTVFWLADSDTRMNRVIDIDPDQAAVVDVRYPTVEAAGKRVRANAWIFPKLRLMKPATYKLGTKWGTNNTGSRIVIEANAGVTATFAWDNPDDFTGRTQRPEYNGVVLRGQGITWDQANMAEWLSETTDTINRNVMEGITLTNSKGPGALIRGYTLGVPILTAGVFLDCVVSNIRADKSFQGCALARGNDCTGLPSDIFVNGNCVVGNRVSESYVKPYTNPVVSMTVQWLGTPGQCSWSREPAIADGLHGNGSASGDGGGTSFDCVLRFVVNGSTHNVTLTKGPGYNTIQSVVDAINLIAPGELIAVNMYPDENWETVTDRAAMALTLSFAGRRWNSTPITSTPTEVVTNFDIHMDFIQITSAVKTNCVFADNIGWNVGWQFALMQSTASTPRARDWYVVNNCSYSGVDSVGTLLTQFQYHLQHFVYHHNSIVNQGLRLLSLTADAWCEGVGNIHSSLDMTGTSDGRWLTKSLFMGGIGGSTVNRPTDFITGGSTATITPSAIAGDFTPAGVLVASENLIAPAVPFDALGNVRLALDARGAVSLAA